MTPLTLGVGRPVTEIRRHLRSRDDLVALLADFPLSRAMKRAIVEPGGTVEVLGGFAPTEGFPYYGVDVTSKHGRTWHVRVVCDETRHCLRVERAQTVDWADWDTTKRHMSDSPRRT
jgi:hypothetical protein